MSDKEKSGTNWGLVVGLVTGGLAIGGAALAYRSYSADQASKLQKKKKGKANQTTKAVAPKPAPKPATPKAAAAPAQAPKTEAKTAAAPVTETAPVKAEAEATNTDGEMSREDLINMFKFIVSGMDALIFKLARTERQLRAQGVDKDRLLADLSQSYQESMQQIQAKAFEKYTTDESKAERAIMKYQDDAEFKQIRQRMDLINNALMGGVPPADPEMLAAMPAWLSVDKVIEIFTSMMETMTQSMVESVEEVSAKHTGPPPHDEVNQRYYEKISEVKDAVLAKYELNEKMLDVAMLKYANDPKLANVMIELQSRQETTFEELRRRVWGGGK